MLGVWGAATLRLGRRFLGRLKRPCKRDRYERLRFENSQLWAGFGPVSGPVLGDHYERLRLEQCCINQRALTRETDEKAAPKGPAQGMGFYVFWPGPGGLREPPGGSPKAIRQGFGGLRGPPGSPRDPPRNGSRICLRASFWCNRHCKTNPVDLEGSWGQVWPKNNRKSTPRALPRGPGGISLSKGLGRVAGKWGRPPIGRHRTAPSGA